MEGNYREFEKYAHKYDFNEKMIEYKYGHSIRVSKESEKIVESLNLEKEKELSSIIGLLHDIARFKQWEKYKTFLDSKLFDHGDEAIKILFEEEQINNYKYEKGAEDIIKKAIKYHNKYNVNFEEMNEREKLHCKIIRDADKIDILYAFSTWRLLELEEDENEISENVRNSFFKNEKIKSEDIKNKNDDIVLFIGLANELYFKYSKKKIYESGYIRNIYNGLKNKKRFLPYIEKIENDLKGSALC